MTVGGSLTTTGGGSTGLGPGRVTSHAMMPPATSTTAPMTSGQTFRLACLATSLNELGPFASTSWLDRYRLRSSASACAEGYRSAFSFAMHLRTICSTCSGTLGLMERSVGGSSLQTFMRICIGVWPWNGCFLHSTAYIVAPSE